MRLSPKLILSAIAVTDIMMMTVKLSPSTAQIIENTFSAYLFPIQLIPDPTDLIAFVMNPVTYFHLKSYCASSKET